MAFVKKLNSTPQLYKNKPGVKPHGANYAVSSGNPSLDEVLGGGLIVGSLTMLLEDSQSQFYGHFLKTYLAEGVVHEQP
jgi:elongator complex protein 4